MGNKLNHSKIYGVDEDIEMSAELGDKVFPHVAIDEYLEKIEELTDKASCLQEMYGILNCDEYMSIDHGMYIAMNKVKLELFGSSRM